MTYLAGGLAGGSVARGRGFFSFWKLFTFSEVSLDERLSFKSTVSEKPLFLAPSPSLGTLFPGNPSLSSVSSNPIFSPSASMVLSPLWNGRPLLLSPIFVLYPSFFLFSFLLVCSFGLVWLKMKVKVSTVNIDANTKAFFVLRDRQNC